MASPSHHHLFYAARSNAQNSKGFVAKGTFHDTKEHKSSPLHTVWNKWVWFQLAYTPSVYNILSPRLSEASERRRCYVVPEYITTPRSDSSRYLPHDYTSLQAQPLIPIRIYCFKIISTNYREWVFKSINESSTKMVPENDINRKVDVWKISFVNCPTAGKGHCWPPLSPGDPVADYSTAKQWRWRVRVWPVKSPQSGSGYSSAIFRYSHGSWTTSYRQASVV